MPRYDCRTPHVLDEIGVALDLGGADEGAQQGAQRVRGGPIAVVPSPRQGVHTHEVVGPTHSASVHSALRGERACASDGVHARARSVAPSGTGSSHPRRARMRRCRSRSRRSAPPRAPAARAASRRGGPWRRRGGGPEASTAGGTERADPHGAPTTGLKQTELKGNFQLGAVNTKTIRM